jgi:hypothetical protein
MKSYGYLNTDKNGAGNTIILPMNSQCQQLFEEKPQISTLWTKFTNTRSLPICCFSI